MQSYVSKGSQDVLLSKMDFKIDYDQKMSSRFRGSYAQTILKYLPPGEVDPTRTTSYEIDFFDAQHGFGRSTYSTVQKSGKSALPVSIYVGTSDTIGGFGSSPLGVTCIVPKLSLICL
jgi:hypothetical protein